MIRRSWMTGASIETTLELWASSLREVKIRMRPLFAQERAALNAGLFVDGLLGDERRKTGWMRAEAAGDPGPWREQAVLGRDRWDADALRDLVRDYVTEHLADENAVLVIDETGFLKQGKASCGVARQYTGSAGKITNCQVGVFAAYVSRHGHAFIDRALYPPQTWTDDPARLSAAPVPPGGTLATQPPLPPAMGGRGIAARGPVPWGAGGRAGTGTAPLVGGGGPRGAIEDGFEPAKNELGLDHDETRSWHGWHRHVSLVMLAFAMLAAIRRRANEASPPKTTGGRPRR